MTRDRQFCEDLIQLDFVILLKAACSDHSKVRRQALQFLVTLSSHFPFLLHKTKVLFTFLDILSALAGQSDDVYDSNAHPIVIAGELLMMDSSAAARAEIQS